MVIIHWQRQPYIAKKSVNIFLTLASVFKFMNHCRMALAFTVDGLPSSSMQVSAWPSAVYMC